MKESHEENGVMKGLEDFYRVRSKSCCDCYFDSNILHGCPAYNGGN